MSFVGTRPEVEKYVHQYNDAMKATLLMPAGITSLARIKYKDEDQYFEMQKIQMKNMLRLFCRKK